MISPITWQEAEKKLGKKVNRRKKYYFDSEPLEKGLEVLELAVLHDTCSGCFESSEGQPIGEYDFHDKHHIWIGAGCDECGHRGIRRSRTYVPVVFIDGEQL